MVEHAKRIGTVWDTKFAGIPPEEAHAKATEIFRAQAERYGIHLSNLVVQIHHEKDGSLFYYATTEVVEGP